MQTKSILNLSLVEGIGNLFYLFSNADGKQWLMPARNMRIAMNLYQPSGRNGKLVKRLFPWVHWLPLVRRVIHVTPSKCRLNDTLNELLELVFLESDLEFAIFGGTPCVHQKITIQVSKGKRILGYCKVTDSADIAALFQREEQILYQLEKKQMGGLPKCLYCGQLETGAYLFIQSTAKTRKSKVVHEWTDLHDVFLQRLEKNTRQTILFEQSDYYQTLVDLQQHIDWLPKEVDGSFIEKCIERIIADKKGKQVEYSAYHADFTPWNMFVESGNLFVFDWEYAKRSYPPYLDYFHFFTQTAIFEKHLDADGIWKLFQQHKKDIKILLNSNQMDFAYLCYLLGNIAHYIKRENGIYSNSMIDYFKVYVHLMRQLLS